MRAVLKTAGKVSAMNILQWTTRNRYEAGLLWTEDSSQLPDSKESLVLWFFNHTFVKIQLITIMVTKGNTLQTFFYQNNDSNCEYKKN